MKSIAAVEWKYAENLAIRAEEDAWEGYIGQLFDTTKKVATKLGKSQRLVKNKGGKLITEIRERRNRWVEHLEGL